jgi:hypothetical protein
MSQPEPAELVLLGGGHSGGEVLGVKERPAGWVGRCGTYAARSGGARRGA